MSDTGPLHVELVSWDDDPPVGGQGVYVRELRRALTDRGIRVTSRSGRGPFAVSYPRITGRRHLDMSIALNISVRSLLDAKPDVVQLSGGPGGIQLLRRLPVPTVYVAYHTHRQSPGWRQVRRLFDRLERRSYDIADTVAAISPSTADAVVAMGVPSSKVVVIPPGIHMPERPTGAETEREEGRILFVGRLEPAKGPLDALAAMDIICQQIRGARGVVVGTGSLSRRVQEAAAATSGRVEYLGNLSDDDVVREYFRAQLVLMPSAFEGLGLVALEAMACGAAVIGYDVEGLRDTIAWRGRLVPGGDVGGLARVGRELLQDPKQLAALAQSATEEVRRERSWPRCAELFEQLYRELVS
ncbi:MAG TPA: glycosyltransferase family 4 protein [Acidimicrobiales bacterium]|nr:glycosyltransferase family 4 protein [Acidimicrobiales bacterium]